MEHLNPYWVTFTGHKPSCVEDVSAEKAQKQAEELTGCKVLTCKSLPYPAEPRISKQQGSCPPFCYDPRNCQGNSCCRKSYACSE